MLADPIRTFPTSLAESLVGDRGIGTAVIITDTDPHTNAVCEVLKRSAFALSVVSSCEALVGIELVCPDVVLVHTGNSQTVLDVCRRMKADADTRLTPVVVVGENDSREMRFSALSAGANEFLAPPIDPVELVLRLRSLVQSKRYTDDFESAAAVMTTLSAMVEARDGYNEGHCHRMANYAVAVGQAIGLCEQELTTLRRGAFLHDIGMLIVSDTILGKATPLLPEEYELIKRHTVYGEALVRQLRALRAVGPIIRHHHERRDGSGYPDALVGDAIPLLAQIIGIADVFEALTSVRAYRPATTTSHALSVLEEHVHRGWRRADLVQHFAKFIRARSSL
jgi:putative two-component system response regulator